VVHLWCSTATIATTSTDTTTTTNKIKIILIIIMLLLLLLFKNTSHMFQKKSWDLVAVCKRDLI